MLPRPRFLRDGAGMRRADALVAGAILALTAIVAAILVVRAGQLGWDEAVYASQARSLVTDVPSAWWFPYRPPGLAILGTVASPAGFTEVGLRAVTAILGLLSVGLVWVTARDVWGSIAGILALVAAIGAPIVLVEIRYFHNDLPSTGVLLLLMVVVWDQFERRAEPNRMLVAVAPIAAAAFYLRFGTAPAIVGIGVGAVLLWPATMRRNVRLIGATLMLGGILLLPHIIDSIATTGSPIGLIVGAASQVNTTGPLVSFRQYVVWLPTSLAGRAPLILLVAGGVHVVVLGIQALRRRRASDDLRRQVWILVPAIIAFAALVLVSHAERRYVLFPLLLGFVSGAGAVSTVVHYLVHSTRPAARRPAVGAAVFVVVVAVLGIAAGRLAWNDVRSAMRVEPPRDWAVAGALIVADAAGACRIVSTIPPLIGWYSGCDVVEFAPKPAGVLAGGGGTAVYVVFSRLDTDRGDRAVLASYRSLIGSGDLIPIAVPSRAAEVYRSTR
jgi:4-amino-4-deoxy-L-arabinose transferase-like glycosyltransferase